MSSLPRLWKQRKLVVYFIGEVVDVTGWLGGYNFQWPGQVDGVAAILKSLLFSDLFQKILASHIQNSTHPTRVAGLREKITTNQGVLHGFDYTKSIYEDVLQM